MTGPVTKTRVAVEPGHVLVDIDLMGAPVALTDEAAAQLRSRLSDAVEDALERFWSTLPENRRCAA